MPEFVYTPQTTNDRSSLTPGWHPGFLVAILTEPTPPQWEMFKASPLMWRWQFALWQDMPSIGRQVPELQSTPTSTKFSPAGKFQASKAFVFTRKLLGRQIEPGEHVSLDPLMPLPCQVLVSRTDKNGAPVEFANLTDLQPWAEGAALLTPEFRQNLATWLQMKGSPQAAGPAPVPAPVLPPPVPVPPAMAPQPAPTPVSSGWGSAPATPAKSGW